jgi:SAM-dependent methyltransferase/uncharacterized protein YbaR (Trm112 family)
LTLKAFEAEEQTPDRQARAESQPLTTTCRWVETGAVFCHSCKALFPVYKGVPVLLNYQTPLAQRAVEAWPQADRRNLLEQGFEPPRGEAPRGEELVSATFSTEWEEYDYGPILWIAPTADRLKTFRGECGLSDGSLRGKLFIEIGCGLGILTNEAAIGLKAEAWGMDLSRAVFRAASQFRQNPAVHFVQASIFAPPFKPGQFDFLYSHGVLHHTWSTKEAVTSAAELVRPDGSAYIWLYGYDDVRISFARRFAYAFESVTRPVIARMPSSLATLFLTPSVPIYQFASLLGRRSGTHGSTYSARQAMHAARDRFTPLFAHRHEYDEVAGWLKALGFKDTHRVGRDEVAGSWGLAVERNVAVRATRR